MGPTRPPGALQSMACGASASEGLVFLALWGILQARGREGLAVGASCPAGQGCAGMAGVGQGGSGVSWLLPCSVPLPQEPVHASCQ